MNGMKGVFDVIVGNLLGFDSIIFIVAAVDLAFFLSARKSALKLYDLLHFEVFVPGQEKEARAAADRISHLREADVIALRKNASGRYNFFVNLTGIFPLLGILGTVMSLIPMVANMENMTSNFFAALTSTFWGLVFAIVFKVMDGFISVRMEDNDKNVELFLSRRGETGTGDMPKEDDRKRGE